MENVPEIRDEESLSLWNTLSGDKSAFNEIVSRYQSSLFRLSCFYLGDREEVQDACQEIFLKIYINMNHFLYDRPFKPWFYSIALNHLKSRYRELKLKKSREVTLPDSFSGCSGNTPFRDMEEYSICTDVRRAIDGLPPLLKECTQLYYLDQMHVQEISNLLNLGQENVKSRLFRARKLLKKTLHDIYTPDESDQPDQDQVILNK